MAPRLLLISAFAVLLSAGQGSTEDSLRQGLIALERNELLAARKHLEVAASAEPSDPRAWLGLARACWKSGQREQAAAAISKAISTGKDQPVIQHGLALYFAEAEDWAQAAAFESNFAALSGDGDAFLRAASLYLRGQRAEEAIRTASNALEKTNRADLRNLLGKAYEAAGNSGQALLEFQQAVRLNPYEEGYYFDLAQLLMRHHNFDVAIQVLEASKKVIAKSPQLELALGVAYYGQRRFPDAVASFLRTIDLDPGVPQPYIYLGRTLENATERMLEIERKFTAYAEAHPKSALGPFLVAKAIFVQLPPGGYPPQAEKAEALLRRSLAIKENEWETHHLLGSLLERKGDLDQAAASLKRAIELNPANPAPHLPLARVYLRQGNKDDAARERTLFKDLTQAQETAIQERAASMKRFELSVK
ncbi:MAG: tetratricopeptide repeat protein [Bryobacteraceae bacterium]|nr:tetratricopeptide repeat protein [Bryobacteraceae bacterium]